MAYRCGGACLRTSTVCFTHMAFRSFTGGWKAVVADEGATTTHDKRRIIATGPRAHVAAAAGYFMRAYGTTWAPGAAGTVENVPGSLCSVSMPRIPAIITKIKGLL